MIAAYLTPERKHDWAQDCQRGIVERLKHLLEHHTKEELSVSAIEEVALQLRLASVNLMGCAHVLREVEEERKILLREMEKQRLRFEPEPEGGAEA